MKDKIQTALITIDHLNIGILIIAGIAFFGIAIFFVVHSKDLIRNISDSLRDPVTGKWSPKILTAFAMSSMIVASHIIWLKYAFVNNDFAQLQPILIIDYSYISLAYGMKMAEKMQAKKIDSKPTEDPKT